LYFREGDIVSKHRRAEQWALSGYSFGVGKVRLLTRLLALSAVCLLATTVAGTAAHAIPASPAGIAGVADAKSLAAQSAARLIGANAAGLHISTGDAFVRHPVISSKEGLQYVPYDRTHKGLPVYGGDFVVVTDATGQVLSTTVTQTAPIKLASISAAVGADAAAATARGRQKAAVDSVSATHLVVYALAGTPRLSWESVVAGHRGTVPSRLHVFVDATSGAVLHSYDEVAYGSGNAAINGGSVTIQTSDSGTSFSMTDSTRAGISCRNETGGAVLTGPDDVWGNGVGSNIETGCVDALYSVQHEWDMLGSWLGRNGINGSGGGFPIFVGLNDLNAFWNGSQVHIGHNQAGGWLSSLDVVGHEFGHAIDSNTPGGGSASGVSEATGDIFGAATEFFTNNTAFDPPDFSIGEEVDLQGRGPIRQMFNPSLVGNPNCYSDAIPTMETHDAAGPFDHWFVLAAQGSAASSGLPASPTCNGSAVSGLGVQTAMRIFYNAMLSKTSAMTYLRYRTATLNAAKNLFPGNCAPFRTIKAAWDAVSVPAQTADPTCDSAALFMRNDGLYAVGRIDAGGFVQTQQGTGAASNWTHIVAVGANVLLVRNDGVFAVGRVEGGQFIQTQQGTGAALNWTHIVAIGNDVLFVRNDGLWAVGRITGGQFVQTQQGTGAAPNWTHVVPVGDNVLFVRNDGLWAVGRITGGQFVQTQQGTGAAPNWTHVVAAGNKVLFVRNDGLFAVGQVDGGQFVQTQQGTGAAPNWTHVVPVRDDQLFVRNDGLFAVARIDGGVLAQTQQGTGAAPNWTHIVAIGDDLLFVRNDGLFAVGRISGGGFVQTQQGTGAAPNWNHIVAVRNG
jgi:Zn-dependent metalloprotease